jgi:hypothetical protein
MVFLNHFQLPVRYDVGTKLLANFEQDKATHISDHIQEWRRRKSFIKAMVSPEFLLEWFLKYLPPYISKDVVTLGVFFGRISDLLGTTTRYYLISIWHAL